MIVWVPRVAMKGGDVQLGDNEPVDEAEKRAHRYHNNKGHQETDLRPVVHTARVGGVLEQGAGQAGAQAHRASGGQVRALGDEAPGHAQGDEEPYGGIADETVEVSYREEVVNGEAHNNAGNHQQDHNGILFNQLPDLLGERSRRLFHILYPPLSVRLKQIAWPIP